jgi:hypothetical protein
MTLRFRLSTIGVQPPLAIAARETSGDIPDSAAAK